MTHRTTASLFSGGCGVECGFRAAGFRPIWTVECDPAIAAIGALNVPEARSIVARVQDVDYATLERPGHLHASPVCKNASQAKADGTEAEEDISSAEAVVRALEALQPQSFTLENVWGYRAFESFKRICAALTRLRYSFDYWHLNSANYGVAQTRRRLILIAKRGEYRIQRPEPTHREGGDLFTPPWVGWYEAIEDLIPMLPESKFAPWQLARLPEHLTQTTMLWNMDQTMRDVTQRTADQPVPTIDTGMFRRPSSIPQAFIVHANDMRTMPVREGGSPMFTVMAGSNNTHAPGTMPKAFVVSNGATGWHDGVVTRNADEPMITITTGTVGRAKAWLIGSENAGQEWGGTRYGDEPAMTISTGQKPRAWLSQGRVVAMTPRALARFQSVPDSYWLPEKNSLACLVVGNMVPPRLAQVVAESL